MQVLGDLLRVRTLVRQQAAKHDESRTQEYLYAASRGDANQIQQVCVGPQPFLSNFSLGSSQHLILSVHTGVFLEQSLVCAATICKNLQIVMRESHTLFRLDQQYCSMYAPPPAVAATWLPNRTHA